MHLLTTLVGGRRHAWLTLIASVLVLGGLFAALPKSGSESAPQAGLPATSEAKQVADQLDKFPSADTTAAIVVWSRADGQLTTDDRTAIEATASDLAAASTTPEATRVQFSDDGEAALAAVVLDAAAVDDDLQSIATTLRGLASTGLPAGVNAYLTGPVGFQADIAGAFAGADLRLLLITIAVVALLLIVTYRSPVLWIVPLLVVATADGLARFAVTAVADASGLPVDASIAGILSVLVFGAGTNYALLLVARYREELRRTADRFTAMGVAVRGAGPAILASGGTVVASLLMLSFADLAGTRALGIACAIGIAIAMVFALIVLPAALVVCGRGLFWPFVPRPGSTESEGFWARLGRRVSRRPLIVAAASVAGIAVLTLGLSGYRVGLSQTEQLVGEPESVTAQDIIDTSFATTQTATTVIIAPEGAANDAAETAAEVDGVANAQPGESTDGVTRIDVTLESEPQSEGAFQSVQLLRADLDAVGAEVLVGGSDAEQLDVRDTAERDFSLIAPLILAVVFAILALLLRAVLAPILLLLTVVATFLASTGVSVWVFQQLLGFDALDTNVTLYAFLFLVALGVDYNIFLVTRAREERRQRGSSEGMIVALGATGGVITSAGVLLAAVFAVLGVLPVVALAQIGVIVCIGVLFDTLVVRTLLVPALVFITGERFWWPSRGSDHAQASRG